MDNRTIEELIENEERLLAKIDELETELVIVKEELEYERQDKEDNYRRLTIAEQIDWSDRW